MSSIVERSRQHRLPVFIHAMEADEYRDAITVDPRVIAHGLSSESNELEKLIREIKDTKIYVTPTLVLFEEFTRFLDDPSNFDDPHIRASVPPFVLKSVMDEENLEEAFGRMDALIKTDTVAWGPEHLSNFGRNHQTLR